MLWMPTLKIKLKYYIYFCTNWAQNKLKIKPFIGFLVLSMQTYDRDK